MWHALWQLHHWSDLYTVTNAGIIRASNMRTCLSMYGSQDSIFAAGKSFTELVYCYLQLVSGQPRICPVFAYDLSSTFDTSHSAVCFFALLLMWSLLDDKLYGQFGLWCSYTKISSMSHTIITRYWQCETGEWLIYKWKVHRKSYQYVDSHTGMPNDVHLVHLTNFSKHGSYY